MKTCSTCHEEKPFGDFHLDKFNKDGRQYNCKACSILSSLAWRATHLERHAATQRATHLRNSYGLTVEDYQAMFAAQGGVCAVCGSPPGNRALDVDHDHSSGKVRALLCTNCNTILGMVNDDPRRLQAAIAYLERVNNQITSAFLNEVSFSLMEG